MFRDGGDGALFVRESITAAAPTTVVARALRYRARDGKLVECWLYDHDQNLVDEAWTDVEPGATSGRAVRRFGSIRPITLSRWKLRLYCCIV